MQLSVVDIHDRDERGDPRGRFAASRPGPRDEGREGLGVHTGDVSRTHDRDPYWFAHYP
jgi:hypothetical protein